MRIGPSGLLLVISHLFADPSLGVRRTTLLEKLHSRYPSLLKSPAHEHDINHEVRRTPGFEDVNNNLAEFKFRSITGRTFVRKDSRYEFF
jgi:hypothetical protein